MRVFTDDELYDARVEAMLDASDAFNDEVLCCPDCEEPNQFGELCHRCIAERELEGGEE